LIVELKFQLKYAQQKLEEDVKRVELIAVIKQQIYHVYGIEQRPQLVIGLDQLVLIKHVLMHQHH
jgi:hypothetical protein